MQEKNWIRIFAVSIALIAGISFLFAGDVFAVPDIYANIPTKNYNWLLVAIGEVSTLLTVAFFLALASILDRQKEMVAAMSEIACKTKKSEEPLENENEQNLDSADNTPDESKKLTALAEWSPWHSEITCLNCKTHQKANNTKCINCGAEFIQPYL